jgi:hypothetical protein
VDDRIRRAEAPDAGRHGPRGIAIDEVSDGDVRAPVGQRCQRRGTGGVAGGPTT